MNQISLFKYKSKSRSSGGGKTSTSTSDQERTRKLFAPEDFLKLPQGNCILISPGYSSKKEANVPRRCNIKIPKVDADRAENSKSRWEALKVELEQEGHQISITDAAILARKDYFLDNFPLPAKDAPATPKFVPAWAEGL